VWYQLVALTEVRSFRVGLVGFKTVGYEDQVFEKKFWT
jgi:hypothetical protein